jgi:hypothetical protein
MCRWSWLAVGAFVQMTTAAYAQNGQRPPDPPWQQTDVGDVGTAGSATVGSDADLFINGAGSDIWGTADSFHFVYQTMYDGEIGTNAGPSLQNTHPHAKIGLMIRLTLAADSPHVVLDLQPDGSIEFMQRATAGGETTFIGGVAAGVSPGWNLRLLRSNGTITAFACARMCRTVGTASFPNGPAFVGAVITSHDPSTLNHGFFPASPPYVRTLPQGWSSGDVGDVGIRGAGYFQNDTFLVQGAGADIWGTADAYHIVMNGIAGNGSVVARVTSEDASNTFAKAGIVATFPSLQTAVILDARPNGAIEFMSRPTSGASMSFVAGSASQLPIWLKLQRQGNTFSGFTSTDGQQWQFIGSIDVSLSNIITVGLAVTSHDTSVLNTATFDHVMVSSDAFQDLDIGDVGAPGFASTSDTNLFVGGSGSDIWGTTDSFNYFYANLINDGRVYAQISRLDDTNPFAKAGLMIRASTDPSAAHVILDVKPNGGIELMTRPSQGAATAFVAGTTRSFPVQLQLERSGSTVTAWVVDGTQMTKLGELSVDLPSDALIGLAVTSHERGTLATGLFPSASR